MNPFRETIVASPWNTTRADVPEIHGRVFEQCLKGIEEVRAGGVSKGLLIHGEAGSGKTHLLSRLREQLMPALPSATNRKECLYVWIRLQTSPRMIWRTVRRALVEDWFRPLDDGCFQFERILFHRFAEIRPAEGDLERWYEYMLEKDPRGLEQCMEEIAIKLHLDRNTAVAFEHIAFRRHLRDLRAWLAGVSLPEATLDRMKFSQDEGTDEDREHESRQVVLMLCKLAGNGLPIVLSFDQVEALRIRPDDQEALPTFGQLISTLHDETNNVLLISCVQSAFATDMRDQVRGADYDRMTDFGERALNRLDRGQALQLINKRLEKTEHHAAPWPLGQGEFEALFAGGGVSPRKLLGLCAERFETPGEPPTSPRPGDDSVETFLDEKWETCVDEKVKENTPDRTEAIVRHGFPMLAQIIARDHKPVSDEKLRDIPLIFEDQETQNRTGLCISTQADMRSLAAVLKRIRTQTSLNRLQRLVIIRDSRVPVTKTAKVAQECLDDLEQQGAIILHPTAEALAALDALRELLSDAKSGDLSCGGEAVAPLTVEEWIKSHLSSDLRELTEGILGGPPDSGTGAGASDAHEIEALNGLLSRNPVMPLGEAAEALRRPVEEVAETVRRHPGHFRVLGEPPALMFRAVEGD